MRILLTASRNWHNEQAIQAALLLQWSKQPWSEVTVIHGDEQKGGDNIARRFCTMHSVREERHPCHEECAYCGEAHMWDILGKTAGPVRNKAMVSTGADICLAFPLGTGWSGTRGCMKLAEAARIPVLNLGSAA